MVYYNYRNKQGKELMKMAKVIVDFGKPYVKQTEEVKKVLCEHDFYEVANLLNFKKRLKEFKKNY
jgi:hypothetical protein